jgi:hypothetical protein
MEWNIGAGYADAPDSDSTHVDDHSRQSWPSTLEMSFSTSARPAVLGSSAE